MIVLVLLSSLSFSGNLDDNSSKVFDDSKAPAKTEAPAKPETAKPAATPLAKPVEGTETPDKK